MPFVVSLYHRIKRQVNGKNYCRSHKKKEQSCSIKSVAVLLLFRDCNQARQTDAIIFSLSLTSVLLPYQYPLPLSRPMLLRRANCDAGQTTATTERPIGNCGHACRNDYAFKLFVRQFVSNRRHSRFFSKKLLPLKHFQGADRECFGICHLLVCATSLWGLQR